MNQLMVPISFTKIQFSKIYSLCGHMGGKSVGRVFSVDLLAKPMKDSFSRAACNYVERNCNLRQYNELPPKNILVALQQQRKKKLWIKQKNLTLLFIVIWPRLFSSLLPLFEKFRCFCIVRNECKWQGSFTLSFLWETISQLEKERTCNKKR